MRNAIGSPHGRATIEVGIAGGASFMSEEPDVLVVPAVPIVIVSTSVIPSVAVVMFIVVGVLPIGCLVVVVSALSSS